MVFVSIRWALSSLIQLSLEKYIHYTRLVVDQLHVHPNTSILVEKFRPPAKEQAEESGQESTSPDYVSEPELPWLLSDAHKDDRAAVDVNDVAANQLTGYVDGQACECETSFGQKFVFPYKRRRRRTRGSNQQCGEQAGLTVRSKLLSELTSGITSYGPWMHLQETSPAVEEAISTGSDTCESEAAEPDTEAAEYEPETEQPYSPPTMFSSLHAGRRLSAQTHKENSQSAVFRPNRFELLEVERTKDGAEHIQEDSSSSLSEEGQSSDKALSSCSSDSDSDSEIAQGPVNIAAKMRRSLSDLSRMAELVPLLDSEFEDDIRSMGRHHPQDDDSMEDGLFDNSFPSCSPRSFHEKQNRSAVAESTSPHSCVSATPPPYSQAPTSYHPSVLSGRYLDGTYRRWSVDMSYVVEAGDSG